MEIPAILKHIFYGEADFTDFNKYNPRNPWRFLA